MKPKFYSTNLNEKIFFILLLGFQLIFVFIQYYWFSYNELNLDSLMLTSDHSFSMLDNNYYLIVFTIFSVLVVLLQQTKFNFREGLFLFSLYLFSFQFGILTNAVFEQVGDQQFGKYELSIQKFCLSIDVILLVLFSLETVFGTVTTLHRLLIIILEVPIFLINKQINQKIIGTLDEGGTISLFLFSSIFTNQIRNTLLLYVSPKIKILEKMERNRENILNLRILLLVIFAPLFSTIIEQRNSQIENFINCLLALSCSIASVYICSEFFGNRFVGGIVTAISCIVVLLSNDSKVYNLSKGFPAGSKQPLIQIIGMLVTFIVAWIWGTVSSKILIFLTTRLELPLSNVNLSSRTYQSTKIETTLEKEIKVWGSLKKNDTKHNHNHNHNHNRTSYNYNNFNFHKGND
ncbi:rh50 [Anaeramoeba flamelloides]|uniref:Rh50 n=1 Tax=Anaeramoeba flamelloides TaxID=1746091 RepID=A0ABQ8XJS7_9EUKA|nr:rh50 [Anaeramoeba flamelloides]